MASSPALYSLVAVTNNWQFDGEMSRRRGDSAKLESVDTGLEERARPNRWIRAPHKIKNKPYMSAAKKEKEVCLFRMELD